LAGLHVLLYVYLLPLWLASSVGALLFYVQHNAPGVRMFHRGDWNYGRSATESSTFLDGGWLFHWFTGNIGFHHTHHLNPRIPFYRLPEATDAMGMRSAGVPLRASANDLLGCLRCFLWDDDAQRFITRSEYRAKAIGRPSPAPRRLPST
jgi:acyl-lipid omega-6 desaturase (Delta-12 desaturase)